MLEIEGLKVDWLGQAGFRIEGEGKVVYIDPFEIEKDEEADLILITHSHYDHLSLADIERLVKKGTRIVAPFNCQEKLSTFKKDQLITVRPDETLKVTGIKIETIPAYNLDKPFHPKTNNWVGYVITVEGKRIYHAGDTDLIPEMKNLKNIGIALLPVGGTYTMNVSQAAEAANLINPRRAIPMHYGKVVGGKKDAERFKNLCKVNVEILGC